jgi:hypothetical protein
VRLRYRRANQRLRYKWPDHATILVEGLEEISRGTWLKAPNKGGVCNFPRIGTAATRTINSKASSHPYMRTCSLEEGFVNNKEITCGAHYGATYGGYPCTCTDRGASDNQARNVACEVVGMHANASMPIANKMILFMISSLKVNLRIPFDAPRSKHRALLLMHVVF